ncbi:MAG TPA: hypothetical protein VGA08_02985 [Candidatus Saccharimonadales bacterium]
MLNKIKPQLKQVLRFFSNYRYSLLGLVVVGLCIYSVSLVNSELSPERDEQAYQQALSDIDEVKFDQQAVQTIVRLRDLRVDVNSIFAPGRTNPFE